MAAMNPEDRLERIRKARAEYDRARTRLFREIKEGLAEGEALPEDRKRELGPSAISHASSFTREYIAKVRDGKTKTPQ